MRARIIVLGLVALAVLTAEGGRQARGADIDGVWLSDAAYCRKIFERRGPQVSFAKSLDTYGNGFIIEGNQIIGRIARCAIRTRREQGAVINLIAVCSTDIAIDTMQFRLRVEGPNKIVREFPGLPEMEIAYERCLI
jgi:hypothetical protein